jgi:phosphatidylinositol alpha-1,6-mannosyltransferase
MHVRNWSALAAANEAGLPTVLSTYALELEETDLSAAAINAADIVHAISEFTASLVDDAVEGSVETRLIYPSIDISAYQTAHEQVTQEKDKAPVLTMARFVDRKNIETVIRAWKQMDEAAIADRDLIVAGDGPKREAFERLAADRDDVRFVGWVNGEEKRELLAESAAFVMVPRRDEFDVEGFGIVYIEAQAAGTPVVGSKHGGAPEAIGDAGIIVDDESDPTNVGVAIETLLDTDQQTKYEQKAAERIGQFDIPVITEKFLSLYDSLMSRSA